MKFTKIISTILHPIVIPTIGVMLYFLLVPSTISSNQKLSILSLIFVATYLIPLLILIVFKKLKFIKNYKTESIKERKLPVLLMIILFFLLGNTIDKQLILKDIALLFYASSLGLILIYILFYFKVKTSIHLLSLGISVGFFLVLSSIYSQSFTIVIIIIFLLAGLLASARLKLKAHNTKEVYLGFFIGILSTLSIYYIL